MSYPISELQKQAFQAFKHELFKSLDEQAQQLDSLEAEADTKTWFRVFDSMIMTRYKLNEITKELGEHVI